jgi:hypothetical protein
MLRIVCIRFPALFFSLLLFNAAPLAAEPSCRQTAGNSKAQELARECVKISEATHPPCNVANPRDMMVDEIKRSCALRREAGIATPSFCNCYLCNRP